MAGICIAGWFGTGAQRSRWWRAVQALLAVGLGLAGWACGAATAPVPSGERVALVIGNSAYKTVPLDNPRNDARAMARLLEQAGFRVDSQTDTSQKDLRAAVERFGAAIRDPKVKFGLFYYAGHGLQLEWRNYLVPVSADIHSAQDVREQTVDVSELLKYMGEAKGRSFLVILDACRDDPFGEAYRPPAKGLSQFDAPVGSLLAYATAPGSVAQDGVGENGLYTGNLLREFSARGTRLEDAFKRVRLNVRLASRGQQIPWESTSLEEDVYMFPSDRRKLSEAEQDQLLEKEIGDWLKVKSSTDAQALAEFIREYPSGSASELAQSRLNRILVAQAAQEERRIIVASRDLAQAEARRAEQETAQREREVAAQREKELAQQRAAAAQEAARAEAERAESARLALARAEAERAEAARQEAERLRAERERAELLARQEAQRRAQEQAREQAAREAALQAERARLEKEQQAAAAQEAARAEAERAQAARLALAKAEAERAEAARLETMRQEALRAQAQEAARQEAARLAQQQAREAVALEAARQAEQARLQKEQAEAAIQARARAEAERAQALREAAAREEAQRIQVARLEQARVEAERARAEEARRQEAARLAEQQAREAAARAAALEAARAQAASAAAAQAAQGVALAATDLPATPFSKGYSEHRRNYRVGDVHSFRIVDGLTKIAKPRVLTVSSVDLVNDRIEFNGGEYATDTMGNNLATDRGAFTHPRQFYPAELFVGKKWITMFKQTRADGTVYTYRYDVKVVGRENVTVPAGTFNAFKIEARGHNLQVPSNLERNIWVVPGLSADVAHEIIVRRPGGRFEQYDRWELVSLTQAR